MLNLCLPVGDGTGWNVAGSHIVTEMNKLTPIRLWANRQTTPPEFHPYIPADYDEAISSGLPMAVDEPLLHTIEGSSLLPMNKHLWSRDRNTGYCFIEDFRVAELYKNNADRYWDTIVAGSTWCSQNLSKILDRDVFTVIQGVDHSIFKPCDCPKPLEDRFAIFTGGKFEYRKGQDLVIVAFRHLCKKYPELHLVCSWWNIWPHTVRSMEESQHIQLPSGNREWLVGRDINKFYAEMMEINGIPANRYTLLPLISNTAMSDIYRTCNVGLFPNRAEAGTNLPMMEAMSTGLPVLATYATGHTDVLGDTPFEAKFQIRTGKGISNGWFDADLKAVIDSVERALQDRSGLTTLSLLQRERMQPFTWAATARALLDIVE